MRSGHGYLPASLLLFNSYSLVLEFEKYIIKIQLYVYIKKPSSCQEEAMSFGPSSSSAMTSFPAS